MAFASAGARHSTAARLRPGEFGYDLDTVAHQQSHADDYGLATSRVAWRLRASSRLPR